MENNTVVKKKNVITSFQGFRGYAILFIFLTHCPLLLPDGSGSNYFARIAQTGVSGFIMLSGFLTMYVYEDRKLPNPFKLLLSKMKKFYPLHIITLFISIPCRP